jgi:hypothetical protein
LTGKTVRSMPESVALSAILCCPTAAISATAAAAIASAGVRMGFRVRVFFMVVLLLAFSFVQLNGDNVGNGEVFLCSLCLVLVSSIHLFSNAKIFFQSSFMLMTVQPSFFASAISASLNVPIFDSAP